MQRTNSSHYLCLLFFIGNHHYLFHAYNRRRAPQIASHRSGVTRANIVGLLEWNESGQMATTIFVCFLYYQRDGTHKIYFCGSKFCSSKFVILLGCGQDQS